MQSELLSWDRRDLLILECVIVQEVERSVHIFIRLGVPQSHIIPFVSQFLNIFDTLMRVKVCYISTHSSVSRICITPYVAISLYWLAINKRAYLDPLQLDRNTLLLEKFVSASLSLSAKLGALLAVLLLLSSSLL